MKKRKILSVILCLIILMSICVLPVSAENTANGRYTVRYHVDENVYTTNRIGESFQIDYIGSNGDSLYGKIIDGTSAIIGWTIEETGETIYYNHVDGTYITSAPGTYNLYPLTTPVALSAEEVYSFTNTSYYFNIDGQNRYFMTPEDTKRLVLGTYDVGRFTPLALPAAVVAAVLSAYPGFEWNGACIGFASTVCLQKTGLLDVVSTQEGATCIRDLEPNEDIISLLNYYNAQAAANVLTKNKGLISGGKEYSRQLKKLYNCAVDGNLILLEFYIIPTLYHGVAVTGAYSDNEGNHYLLCYDENSSSYSRGYVQTMHIKPDFSEIDTGYGEINGFLWTDTFEGYKSFDINAEYSRIPYHMELIKHVAETLIEWVGTYILGMFKAFA